MNEIIGRGDLNPPKIDDQATLGLLGTHNSLAARVHEIEMHFHSIERWFGTDADGTGSTANNMVEWQVVAGTGEAFGTEVQLLGANDIAVADFGFIPVKFDLHRVFVTGSSANNANYVVQLWSGTGTFGEAVLRTEILYRKSSTVLEVTPIEMQMARIGVEEKVWARCKSETNGATIDFVVGIHAYVG